MALAIRSIDSLAIADSSDIELGQVEVYGNGDDYYPVDAEAAKAYKAAPPDNQKKIQALVSLWLRDLATAEPATLKEIMSDVSKKAQARGLTPELLESLLKEA
jgi:hypothetical protein